MKRLNYKVAILAGAVSLAASVQAGAAVGLVFTNNGPALTSTSAVVAPGGSFNFSVDLTESSASDQVTGADYFIKASTAGFVEFISRNSAGGFFTSPNGFSDSYLNSSSYSPHVLNSDTSTDMGTSLTNSAIFLSGPSSYDLGDFVFKVLPNTLPGVYTLSFTRDNYLGPPNNYASTPLDSVGTYTVTVAVSVPEPATVSLIVLGAGLSLIRRRRV